MTKQQLWQRYEALLNKASFIVTYSALSDEIKITEIPFYEVIKNKPYYTVPPSHKITPENIADQILRIAQPDTVIFLPGQKFDFHGTRQGRGFGWYDRLLANLPREWTRIGVAKNKKISTTKLIRNAWDQPVDWLIWQNENYWGITETIAKKPSAKQQQTVN